MEEWRPIVGFEGSYEVSSLGRVRSVTREIRHGCVTRMSIGRVLKQTSDKNGYTQVGLHEDAVTYTRKVHRLVAFHFIPNPDNKPQVNHLNGIRSDNAKANLEWSTCTENHRHAIQVLGRDMKDRGRRIKAEKEGHETLIFRSSKDAQRQGFNRNGVLFALSGEYSHHRGYKWSYIDE